MDIDKDINPPKNRRYKVTYIVPGKPSSETPFNIHNLNCKGVECLAELLLALKRRFRILDVETGIIWDIQNGTDFASYLTCS